MVAPVFNNSALVTIGGDYVDVGYTVDQDARVFIIVQDEAAPAPSEAQVKAGLDGNGAPAVSFFDSVGFKNGGGAYVDRLVDLTVATSYDAYAVATNAADEDSALEAVASAFSTPPAYDPGPNHPDPWPPADGDPGEGEFGSTLPDSYNPSFEKLIQDLWTKPVATQQADATIAFSFLISFTTELTGVTWALAILPTGSKPPTVDEVFAAPDYGPFALLSQSYFELLTGANTGGAIVDEQGYDIYFAINANEGAYVAHVGFEASTLGPEDAPYIAFDADGSALPSMPAGIQPWVRASDVD